MTRTFDLTDYLRAEVARVDAALERALDAEAVHALAAGVRVAVAHGVRSGGKRLRPVLCVEAWRAVRRAKGLGVDAAPDAAYDLAVSLELIHAYSLMHDDLPCMDDADLRRGQPTTWKVHGEADTVAGGVALIPLAALQALRSARALGCAEAVARHAAETLLGAAGSGGMVGGQGLDLLGEDRALSSDELDELHAHKTGALLTASLWVGGIAAEASEAQEAALVGYGRRIGLAFQIADDVLDATASAEALGKRPSDSDLGKSTYVALHGVDEARTRGVEQVDQGLAALSAGGLESPALTALAHYVMERDR